MESELLSQSECRALFEQAQRSAARAGIRDVEVSVQASSEALTRFANNGIHQNVSERVRGLSVRLLVDGRTARAGTNRLDAEGVAAAVEQCAALARASEPDPDLLPMYSGSDKPSATFFPSPPCFDRATRT